MKIQFLKKSATMAAGLALLAALSTVPTGRAQNYGPWSAPINLNAIVLSDRTSCPVNPNSNFNVNSASNDQHPTISKDGLSLFFASTRPGPDRNGQIGLGDFDLWVTKRDSLDDCWQPPFNLGPRVNSASLDFAPNLTTDGHWLYFHSKRPTWLTADGVEVPSCGGADLYVSHRQDAGNDFGWETPINLGCAINTPGFDQAGPNYFEDDTTGTHFLYFTRRPIGASEDFFDIYVSTCTADLATCNTQGLWGPGELVAALSVPFDPLNPGFGRDTRTAIRRRDGLEMILSSKRLGGLGLIDLWSSTRATTQDQNWSVPINLTVVNSPANDGAPALSWDGTQLYFYSDRVDLPGAAGGTDLYVSTRTKLTGTN